MKTVGIKELKAKLSSYLDDIRAGERTIVTDRGEEVAVLSPISDEYRLMQLLHKSGKAQWSKGKPQGLDRGIVVKGVSVSTTILEERQ
ncbi:type II toxin-antitoxin system Phd/YefM family antitoxin [Syntrophorhabdus aromaticivorans]|jgi:prevent-host-death family protein|uniref:Antitoxin n=1 Tax=Syntrophorhabdus aromaticivorans TaxID=328301 RepID=A0A351U7G5_9BACT|nr:type II toxin-antitoxin system Phd/YefM family antitoxin [Syntrophorhabdus aromaticivorans]NLW36467.1 type II toxin-antitoxin system Phd/YefM family antitoxin [Syntrophorhabdus aromaticivorans]HBA55896.1 type II toxin-antitoxin system Phd/YefM family antitoxin [Syntrophorhabdus aromaticivorans]